MQLQKEAESKSALNPTLVPAAPVALNSKFLRQFAKGRQGGVGGCQVLASVWAVAHVTRANISSTDRPHPEHLLLTSFN
jgi:hypothetical protein